MLELIQPMGHHFHMRIFDVCFTDQGQTRIALTRHSGTNSYNFIQMNPARPQLGISFFPKNTEFVTLDFWTLGLWDFETSGLFDCWTLELLDFWTLDFWAFRFAHCCTLGLVDFSTFVFLGGGFRLFDLWTLGVWDF